METGMNTTVDGSSGQGYNDYLEDYLIEEIWQDLNQQFSIDKIREVALETASEFQDAIVTAFLPIFIYRRTREKLMKTLDHSSGED